MSQLKVQVGQPVQYIGISDKALAAQVLKVLPNGNVDLLVWSFDGSTDLIDGGHVTNNVPQYVDTFDMRKIDQAHSYRVIRF